MNRCKTCAHWKATGLGSDWGRCEYDDTETTGTATTRPDMEILSHDGYNSADLQTTADFGCVLQSELVEKPRICDATLDWKDERLDALRCRLDYGHAGKHSVNI